VEDSLDWNAQDKEGNVWYFIEDIKDHENDKVVSTEGSWQAGVVGVKPGIAMEANPHPTGCLRNRLINPTSWNRSPASRRNERRSPSAASYKMRGRRRRICSQI
jgi:hypothetical protein